MKMEEPKAVAAREREARKSRIRMLVISIGVHLVLLLILANVVIFHYIDKKDDDGANLTWVKDEDPSVKINNERNLKQKQGKQVRGGGSGTPIGDSRDVAKDQDVIRVAHEAEGPMTDEPPKGIGELGSIGTGGQIGNGFGDSGTAFGGTTEGPDTFKGTVYFFDHIDRIRNGGRWFAGEDRTRGLQPVYTHSFKIPGRNFKEGFVKGTGKQLEYFGIDYAATVDWPENLAGHYEFRLKADDGAIFQIDGRDVIDFDGEHAWNDVSPAYGDCHIAAGRRSLRLAYFQGPRYYVGLLLQYRKRGEKDWHVFDLRRIKTEGSLLAELEPAEDMDTIQ